MKKCLSLILVCVLSASLLVIPSMAVEDIPEETQTSEGNFILAEEDLATVEDVQDYYSALASTAKSSAAGINAMEQMIQPTRVPEEKDLTDIEQGELR